MTDAAGLGAEDTAEAGAETVPDRLGVGEAMGLGRMDKAGDGAENAENGLGVGQATGLGRSIAEAEERADVEDGASLGASAGDARGRSLEPNTLADVAGLETGGENSGASFLSALRCDESELLAAEETMEAEELETDPLRQRCKDY